MSIFNKCWWTRKHDYRWPNTLIRDRDRVICVICGRSGGVTYYAASRGEQS